MSGSVSIGARSVALTIVVGFHLFLAGQLSLDAVRARAVDEGGAPVINLLLEPRIAFDSVNGAEASVAAESASGDAGDSAPAQGAQKVVEPLTERPLALRTPLPAPLVPPPLTVSATPVRRSAGIPAARDRTAPGHAPSSGEGAETTAAEASRRGMTEGGAGQAVGASGQPSVDPYEAEVLRWIEAHKRHPGGVSGLVTVRFTLDRRGRLSGEAVVAGSGRPALDRATLSQLRAAQPFPRAPAESTWRTRDFTVRLDYRARR